MRISDWSSDVCSSDRLDNGDGHPPAQILNISAYRKAVATSGKRNHNGQHRYFCHSNPEVSDIDRSRESFGELCRAHVEYAPADDKPAGQTSQHGNNRQEDRQSVVEGKSMSERVDLGGRGIQKKKNTQ